MERVGAMDLSGVYEEGEIAQGGELVQQGGWDQQGVSGRSRVGVDILERMQGLQRGMDEVRDLLSQSGLCGPDEGGGRIGAVRGARQYCLQVCRGNRTGGTHRCGPSSSGERGKLWEGG